MEVLKLKTPLYLMWGQATMFEADGTQVGTEFYPHSHPLDDTFDKGEYSMLMENVSRFFWDNVETLYPKSIGQRFWLAHLRFDHILKATRLRANIELHVGVVYPWMLKPYGILEDWEIINRKSRHRGKCIGCTDHPFFLPGYSYLGPLHNTLFSIVNGLGGVKNDAMPDEYYFWYHMKKKALGL